MQGKIIDAHIHLDMYTKDEQNQILTDLEQEKITAVVSVSNHLASSIANLRLAEQYEKIYPAFGFHPEQELPSEGELEELIQFIQQYKDQAIAIGEVGLPYYMRQKAVNMNIEPYLELLEVFIKLSKQWDKPISLHAVYEDADLVCDLLEKHSIDKAHFHWFKGSYQTIERMIQNGYFISITPDICYEKEIQQLVKEYPLAHIMVETDGPWPFTGPFANQLTSPVMTHDTIIKIAQIKKQSIANVYEQIFTTTKQFFAL